MPLKDEIKAFMFKLGVEATDVLYVSLGNDDWKIDFKSFITSLNTEELVDVPVYNFTLVAEKWIMFYCTTDNVWKVQYLFKPPTQILPEDKDVRDFIFRREGCTFSNIAGDVIVRPGDASYESVLTSALSI